MYGIIIALSCIVGRSIDRHIDRYIDRYIDRHIDRYIDRWILISAGSHLMHR